MKNVIYKDIIEDFIKTGKYNKKALEEAKKRICSKYHRASIVNNAELIDAYGEMTRKKELVLKRSVNTKLANIFRTNHVRSASGVVILTICMKDMGCPGKCVYCPTAKGLPKSYLDGEPAIMRAKRCDFDAKLQVETRIRALESTGHAVDKIEVRILGATFNAYPLFYQDEFILGIYEGLNGEKSLTVKDATRKNQYGKYRCVGMSVETRPDWIKIADIKRFREYGVTCVELGVQSIDDDVLRLINRGHAVSESTRAIKLLRDCGFKIHLHMMPNLPGARYKDELPMYERFFASDDFCPDYLKIYPCVVTKEAEIYSWQEKGDYEAYSDDDMIDLLARIKSLVPKYVRLMRVGRDVPATYIHGGNKISNIREIVTKKMKGLGLQCQCIRCREIKQNTFQASDVQIVGDEFVANGGREFFIRMEDVAQDKILSLLRLRICNNEEVNTVFPELSGCLLVRELHTYGEMMPIGVQRDKQGVDHVSGAQHRGYGKKLMQEAERVAKKAGLRKIAVISGIGVMQYYEKLGYKEEGLYMTKEV